MSLSVCGACHCHSTKLAHCVHYSDASGIINCNTRVRGNNIFAFNNQKNVKVKKSMIICAQISIMNMNMLFEHSVSEIEVQCK